MRLFSHASRLSISNMVQTLPLLLGQTPKPFQGDIEFVNTGNQHDFSPYYREHIYPLVREFEEQRVAALVKHQNRLFWLYPIMAIAIIGGIYLYQNNLVNPQMFDFVLYAVLIGAGLFVGWAYMPVYKYYGSVKEQVFPLVFKFFGQDLHFSATSPFNARDLQPSYIIPSFTSEKAEDYVQGSFEDVKLEMYESKLIHESGSGKNRRVSTRFKGLFIILSMNKDFSGQTILKRDQGKLFNWLSGSPNEKFESVRLEDPDFEKMFEVFSTDQIEARYLLTTSFMQRIKDLSELFGAKNIQASFYENKLLLMMPMKKNMFECASIMQPATFVEDINIILKEMQLLFDMISHLKLQQKTGL